MEGGEGGDLNGRTEGISTCSNTSFIFLGHAVLSSGGLLRPQSPDLLLVGRNRQECV